MKYYKTLGIYKNSTSTNEYNPKTYKAHSYSWYCYFKPIKNKLVFNDYNYSKTTQKHLSQTKKLLHDLGIQPNLYIEAPRGLNDLPLAKQHYKNKIQNLQNLINKPKTKKAKNMERLELINKYRTIIHHIERLQK